MKNISITAIIFFSISFGKSGQAQSLKELIAIGSWATSMPIDGLNTSDTLTIEKKSGQNQGWLEFEQDSILRQCQAQHHCVSTNKNSHKMMLDYHWYNRGKWIIDGENLKIILNDKILMCKIISSTPTKVKLKIAGVDIR